MPQNDPRRVAEEYATEQGLAGRAATYSPDRVEGPDAKAMALAAVVEVAPRQVLEVGCGWGEFAAAVAMETGAEVKAIDLSPRMVELACERAVDAEVGDVQALPFGDDAFDVAVANWMLYHVPDVDRAVAELARVLRPGGRLVAVTNGDDHLQELRELLGVQRTSSAFSAENGERILRHAFADVERRDASGWVTFDRAAAERYVASTRVLWEQASLPADFDGPLRVRTAPCVFVATT
jgi:SAM-dependent methyltransferase